jgi:hypothetical protein
VLLLRFLARDYEAMQRLLGGVGTDAALTKEEQYIISELVEVRFRNPFLRNSRSRTFRNFPALLA